MSASKHYFQDPERAKLYDRHRLSFQAEALQSYHQEEPHLKYRQVLDVACGTGHSSQALSHWSQQVMAIDNSQAMLECASPHPRIHYQKANAEELPFADESFEILFVSSSLHWFEKRKFLKEASRVLRPGGTLLIYDSYIYEGLKPEFIQRYDQSFPNTFDDVRLHPSELAVFKFAPQEITLFDYERQLEKKIVGNYFFNLSCVTAALEQGRDPQECEHFIHKLVQENSIADSYIFRVSLGIIRKDSSGH